MLANLNPLLAVVLGVVSPSANELFRWGITKVGVLGNLGNFLLSYCTLGMTRVLLTDEVMVIRDDC